METRSHTVTGGRRRAPGSVRSRADRRPGALVRGAPRVKHANRQRTDAAAQALRARAHMLLAPSNAGDGTGLPPEGRGVPPAHADPEAREPRAGRAAPSVAAPPAGPTEHRRTRGRLWWAVRERLPLWVQLRCGIEPRTLAALAVVLVACAVFAVHHFWSGRPRTVRAPTAEPAATRNVDPEPVAGANARPDSGAPPGGAAGRIVVDVTGKVRDPGIHSLAPGARVADALREAGGVRPGTDTTGLNRARVLADGEQIVVGGPAPPGGGGTGPAPAGAPAGAPVSLNSATVEQLDTLPGVGPVLAQHILDYRAEHGGFRSVDQLREVSGIGDRRFADLRPLVRP